MKPPPQIFDRRLYAQRRARAPGTDFLLRDVAAHLADRIAAMNRRRETALDLSSRDESFEELRGSAEEWKRTSPFPRDGALLADEEALPFAPESFDLIASVLSLHAVNDLPGALIQIRRALKPEGLFVAALFGGETLRQLRHSFAQAESELTGGITPRVAPFADVRDLGALLQRAGFASLVSDVERTTVRYGAFEGLVSDLRALGETNALAGRSRAFLRREVLTAALEHYRNQFAENSRLLATFDVVYLTGRAPQDSAR
jgi:SAM-dependent methyltransferase